LATTVAVLAGTLLLVAAVLKGYEAVMPGPALALHLRLRDLALIEFELALGAMLILNMRPALAWGMALAAYAVFAGFSVQKVMMGAKSCGCFGTAAVNPKIMVAIDLAIVVMLLVAGPRRADTMQRSRLRRAGAALAIVLMLSVAAGIAFAAIPKRGLVATEDGTHDFGKISAAEAIEHTFTVRNTASTPVHITGYKSSCGCTVADIPTAPIASGGSANVVVRASWKDFTGRTASTVTLQTDNRWTPKVELTISGEIVPSP
jgi:hypothetical protein